MIHKKEKKIRRFQNFFYLLSFACVIPLVYLAGILPRVWVTKFTEFCGDVFFLADRRRREIALMNLGIAFGEELTVEEKTRIARTAFRNSALSMAELFLVRKTLSTIHDSFTITGKEHLEEEFQKGKGVVLVISHLGAWEYLSFLSHLEGHRWSTVVKEIRNPYLNKEIEKLRRLMPINPIAKINSIRKVFAELKQNNGVAIVIDQWDGPDGVWVDFFGRPASTTSIPARLAMSTGAALVPGYCIRTGYDRYEVHIHEAVPYVLETDEDELRVTAQLNRLLEEKIKKYPEQWLWMHRRWKVKPKEHRFSS